MRGQIIYTGVTVAEYLVEFKLRKVDGGVKMVSIALGSALDHAREDGAMASVLAVASYVSADQITMELMGNDREAVQRICRLSLLRKEGNGLYSMHRLTQEVARQECTPSLAITVIGEVFVDPFEPSDSNTWNLSRQLVPHAESLSKNISDRSGLEEQLNRDVLIAAFRIVWNCADVYQFVFHDYKSAKMKYNETLDMQRHVYGNDAQNLPGQHTQQPGIALPPAR